MLLVIIFCLPETLYIRDQSRLTRTMSEREIDFTPKTYVSQLGLYSTFPQLKLRWNQFIIPSLKMAKYPSVLFPALYYATSYGFASILPAVTIASIFLKSSTGTLSRLDLHMEEPCQLEVSPLSSVVS
jgi:hypothetical protein